LDQAFWRGGIHVFPAKRAILPFCRSMAAGAMLFLKLTHALDLSLELLAALALRGPAVSPAPICQLFF
jgi:hypothetical protein